MTEYRGELGLFGTPEQWEQARRDGEWHRAEERRREAEAAEDAAALQYDLDSIDALALHYLKDELVAEKETARITSRQRKDYADYRAYARKHGWPHDDARTLFAFLAHDLSRPARVKRLHNSVQAVVRSLGLQDTTNDPAICALIRRLLARKKKSIQPQQEN